MPIGGELPVSEGLPKVGFVKPVGTQAAKREKPVAVVESWRWRWGVVPPTPPKAETGGCGEGVAGAGDSLSVRIGGRRGAWACACAKAGCCGGAI